MTDYKLVPMEPTAEMLEAGKKEVDWYEHNAIDCYQAMLAAAPAVQGEPVAYLRKDQLTHVKRMGPMLGEIADNPRADRVPVYAAPQSAEQKPAPDVAELVEALEFYAKGEHFTPYDPDQWDTVSGEPLNILHHNDGADGSAGFVEDGSIARQAIAAHRKQGGTN